MSIRKRSVKAHVIDIETRRQELLRTCNLIDSDEEKNQSHLHFQRFCEILYDHEESKDETSFNEGDISEELVRVALNMINISYRIKILKILMVYWNKQQIVNVNLYQETKKEIIDLLPLEECHSIFKMSENFISSNCNRKFFELIFLLKENRLKKFEFELEDFIEAHKEYYGEYWKFAMKSDARLLFLTADKLLLNKTYEFIFQKLSFIEMNSTILTEFEETLDFFLIFKDNLSEAEKEFLVSDKINFLTPI